MFSRLLEKAIGKEGEIVAAIQAQRAHLMEEPTDYGVNNPRMATSRSYFDDDVISSKMLMRLPCR